MKKAVLIPIIIGGVLLTVGGAFLTIGLVNNATAKLEEKTFEVSGNYKNFKIDLDTSDVTFIPSEDGLTKVVVKERAKQHHNVKVENEVLIIDYVNERTWFENIFVNNDGLKVDVYVPANTYENLEIKSDTGEISIPSKFGFSSLDINVHTGNVYLECNVFDDANIVASTGNINYNYATLNNLEVTTSTGNMNFSKIKVADYIKTNSSTGKLNLEEVKAKELDLKLNTGDITIVDTLVAGKVNIEASTGDVTIKNSDAESLKIKTSTGDVNATLLTSKIVYAKSGTGKIDVPVSTTGGLCEIETSTGNITVKFE